MIDLLHVRLGVCLTGGRILDLYPSPSSVRNDFTPRLSTSSVSTTLPCPPSVALIEIYRYHRVLEYCLRCDSHPGACHLPQEQVDNIQRPRLEQTKKPASGTGRRHVLPLRSWDHHSLHVTGVVYWSHCKSRFRRYRNFDRFRRGPYDLPSPAIP